MGKINEFRRICHQYDSMKFAVLLILCALYFLVSGIMGFVGYFSNISKPVEYVLISKSPIDMSSTTISKIKALPDFVALSLQSTGSVSIGEADETVFITLHRLSAEYFAYGYGETAAQKHLYLNKADYAKLSDQHKSDRVNYTDYDGIYNNAHITYSDKTNLPQGEGLVLATSADFENECTALRVMFSKTDITGGTIESLQRLGFGIENYDKIIEMANAEELTFTKFKYSAIISFLSTAFAIVLSKKNRNAVRKDNAIQ